MTTFDDDQTTTEAGRFCPECGQPAGDSNFCSRCGHNMGFAGNRTLADTTLQPAAAGRHRSRGRAGLMMAGAGLAIVAGVVAAIVLLNSHTSKASPVVPPAPNVSATYRQQLTKVLAPVVSANRTVSHSLTAMNGSKHATNTAKTHVAAALASLAGARGGLRVLTVPSADMTLSRQVQQALTADNGYLEAVSSTLATPTGTGAGQLQTLATGAQSALVNLDPVAAGASSSIDGTDNLTSWAQGARHHRAAPKNAPAPAPSPTPVPVPTSPAPSPGLTACDQNISVDASTTTCAFADNVFAGYASIVESGGPLSNGVTATSPATGGTYTDSCQDDESTQIVSCSHGTDLIQFPEWAAAVY